MQELGAKTNYFKYSECKDGQTLVDKGVYLGQKQGKFGRQNNFLVGGAKTVLNSAGHLNYKLDEFVKVGDTVTIIYDGKEKLEKGTFAGKECHQFKVMLHDEIPNTKPAPEVQTTVATNSGGSLLDRLNA